MGFLDHSTNNIIVDAVLTDVGRKLLAQNDGSFVVAHFAFGDDEIDYGIIKKFGRTVGKEKIIKNTPVFEAQTNGDLGLKHRLLSVSTPDLTFLPFLQINSIDTQTLIRGSTTSTGMTVSQGIPTSQTTVPTDLSDSRFIVEYDYRFLNVTKSTGAGGSTPVISNNIATVNFTPSTSTASGGQQIGLTISIKDFDATTYYNSYTFKGTGSSAIIRTQVKITGRSSGASVIQTIDIQRG